MHNRRNLLALGLSSLVSSLASVGQAFENAATGGVNFARRYGNNPKSLNGSYRLNSNAAAQKRAARKRRNIAKQAR